MYHMGCLVLVSASLPNATDSEAYSNAVLSSRLHPCIPFVAIRSRYAELTRVMVVTLSYLPSRAPLQLVAPTCKGNEI